jgi:hypothetical protein
MAVVRRALMGQEVETGSRSPSKRVKALVKAPNHFLLA